MSKLYVITGPAGVGKSTISNKLAKKCTKSAIIEGDEIYHQVVGGYVPAWKSGNHLEIFWKICIKIIETYLIEDFDIVFNYIITPKDLELIKNKFSNFNIKFVVLLADESTLLSRDSNRPENCQMKERCVVLLNNFRNRNYNQNNILDTTNLSVDETVKLIENEIRFLL